MTVHFILFIIPLVHLITRLHSVLGFGVFLIIFYFPFFPLLQQNTYSNFLSFFFLFFFCVLLLLNHSVDFNEITLRVVWYRRGGGRQPKVTNLDF